MAQQFLQVEWSKQATVYEVNIRQYTPEGTFAAFAKHLPRLKQLGVQILWFMPITPISKKVRQGTLGSYYACSSYITTNEEFGTVADFTELVAQAHALGMKVIIDWVANHTGWDHEWTISNPEFYKRNQQNEFFDTNGWHDVIDLNYEHTPLVEAMIESMLFWVKQCNIDGFRCDMAHLVPLPFWQQARTAVEKVKSCYWLAETDTHEYFKVFDTLYGWEWMHASEKLIKGEHNLQHFNSLLQYYITQGNECSKLLFTTNHDENSWNGTEFEKYGSYVKAMAVFALLFPGNGLLYSGQEIPNKKRLAFFDKDELSWPNAISETELWYTKLVAFKKQLAALFSSNEVTIYGEYLPQNLLLFEYRSGHQHCIVILNFSTKPVNVAVPNCFTEKPYQNLFSGLQYSFKETEKFSLAAAEYAVYYTL